MPNRSRMRLIMMKLFDLNLRSLRSFKYEIRIVNPFWPQCVSCESFVPRLCIICFRLPRLLRLLSKLSLCHSIPLLIWIDVPHQWIILLWSLIRVRANLVSRLQWLFNPNKFLVYLMQGRDMSVDDRWSVQWSELIIKFSSWISFLNAPLNVVPWPFIWRRGINVSCLSKHLKPFMRLLLHSEFLSWCVLVFVEDCRHWLIQNWIELKLCIVLDFRVASKAL